MVRSQRLRDHAVALPVVIFILLLPPLLRVFGQTGGTGGVPLLLIYLFVVWTVGIVLAFLLARRLGRAYDPHPAREARSERAIARSVALDD